MKFDAMAASGAVSLNISGQNGSTITAVPTMMSAAPQPAVRAAATACLLLVIF